MGEEGGERVEAGGKKWIRVLATKDDQLPPLKPLKANQLPTADLFIEINTDVERGMCQCLVTFNPMVTHTNDYFA